MEVGVGSGKLMDRVGGEFSRYAVQFQGIYMNGEYLPQSQYYPAYDSDGGGFPLQGFP